jgi:hypothetical protein
LLASKIQKVPVSDVQCDEIWSFVGKKESRKTLKKTPEWLRESRIGLGRAQNCFSSGVAGKRFCLDIRLYGA